MQDTVYCFHLLAGRQKRSLLYALCSALLVAAVWLLHPEWPFWAGYIAWALAYAATLIVQHTIPLSIRCPHCGNAGLYSAPQTPEEQRRPDTGIMLECRGCGSTFYTDAYLPWPGKIIRRRPTCPEEWEEKNLPVNKPGPLPPERNAGRKGLSSTEEKSNGLFGSHHVIPHALVCGGGGAHAGNPIAVLILLFFDFRSVAVQFRGEIAGIKNNRPRTCRDNGSGRNLRNHRHWSGKGIIPVHQFLLADRIVRIRSISSVIGGNLYIGRFRKCGLIGRGEQAPNNKKAGLRRQ